MLRFIPAFIPQVLLIHFGDIIQLFNTLVEGFRSHCQR